MVREGEYFELNGAEHLYSDGSIIEIACSYPDMDTCLSELESGIE